MRKEYLRIVVHGKDTPSIRESETGHSTITDISSLSVEDNICWIAGDGYYRGISADPQERLKREV